MSSTHPEPLARLLNALSHLPGIGRRSALRIAYHILDMPAADVSDIADALTAARTQIIRCQVCGNYSTRETCSLCRDTSRDGSVICVVRDPRDIAAMERSGEYRGLYHVLGGTISPNENRGPEQLRIKELLERLRTSDIKELILATNPDLEGEATAMYIARLVKPAGIKCTRIASGVQVGTELEFADEVTLARAMDGRREV